MKTLPFIVASALWMSATAGLAHGPAAHGGHGATSAVAPQQQDWGIAGHSDDAGRTIVLRMTDDMRFTPSHVDVRQGETVRLRVENRGQVLHEVVLGTAQALQAHAEAMRKFPGMEHDEPHMAHVAPGDRQDLVWRFNRAGRFDFACLLPGHYEAGMRGTFTVTP